MNCKDSTDKLKFVSKANQAGKAIRLTEATAMTQSAMWYGNLVNAGKGFETVFSFRMSQGFNATDDGSSPGAEGIAFVIQNSSLTALGFPAGNMGFAGISNSVAIEFDTYNNKTDMNDPDGNHVAVFCNGTNGNYAFHNSQFCLGTSSNIPQMRADNTLYYAKIDYNMEPGKLRVWLDNTGKFDGSPALTIDKFDLAKAINLDNGRAYIGFTSATGDSYQIHEIQSWKYCSSNYYITGVPENKEFYLKFNLPTGGDAEITIFDILGKTVFYSHERELDMGQNSKAVDCRSIPAGIYYCSVKTINNIMVAPFVIQR
ncbi:MAG: Por secretion system C-terminal sorting protein [Ignavibacteria bacterium]|nr:Por secretion system C-terminal sorting protein [Ignavibacteria bacterium]